MEGVGEGMVAIVQALQDAGLSVTLTNPAVGHDHVRRSPAYNGMSNVLKWTGHVSRAMNSQTEGFRRCQAHGGGMRNGMNHNHQLPHGSKSTGSPLNRHLDASPNGFRQHSNDNSFIVNRSKDNVTQTPAREALSTRSPAREALSTRSSAKEPLSIGSSAFWSQRALPSVRSSRTLDAFAESLRKYPNMSPERSTSADIIQRLINYTQTKNLTKSSYHSKSVRSLRNTNEPSNDAIIRRNKSSKNIQTYTRRESPARETCPCCPELRLNGRYRSLHTPRNEGVRCRDSLSATYDYLKAVSPRLSPPRGTEVRYLQDVTKYVKDTLKLMYDEPTTCPKIASRYSQHKRDCLKKARPSSSESINKQIQTSSLRSREASTLTQGEASNHKLRPKTCNSCYRPFPCFSKSSSFRKIRFSATEPCPRYIVREVVPKPECPENDPCPCPDPEVQFRNKLEQHILEWLNEIPVNIQFCCSLDKKVRTKIVMALAEKLMALRGVDDFEDRMRKYILDCLENQPMWLPSGKRARELFKNEIADDLINKLLDLFNTRGKFEKIIVKWVDGLNFDDAGEPVNKEKVVQNFINKLKPLNQYRTSDNDLFRDDLKENILDMLEKLPLHIEGSNIKYYNEKADILVDELARLPKIEINENDLYKKLNDVLKNVDEAKDLKPSERKRLVEQLLGNVKDLITQDMNDDDRQEIIKKVVNDWIGSTHADPGDLISYLRKKILDWLHNKSEFSGDSLFIAEENEELSKDLAMKVNDLLSELLEDENVKNQLLEDINDQLRDTFEKRGDQNDPKTTKKLAKDLLHYLLDTVKESQKGKLERDLIEIVQDELKKTPQLFGDNPYSKRDNDNLSKDIAKKFLQIPSTNLDNKDIKNNLKDDINDQLNEALDRKGQREAPQAMKKLADNLFDKLKNAIQKEKEGNLLENILIKKILESLNEVSELAGANSATKSDNDKFSKDLATKILEVPPEYIDNEDVRYNLLEDINDQLNEALENRGQRKDPKETKELGKNMLNKLVDAIKRGKSSKKDSSCLVSDPLESNLRQKVLEYLNDDPDLSGDTPSNKIYNDNISRVIAKNTKKLLPKLHEDDLVRSQLLEEINDQIKDTLEDREIDKSPKIIKKMANDLLNNLVNTVKESQEGSVSNLEKDLRKIVQFRLKNTPQLTGDTPSSKRDNDNLSKDIAKKFLQVPSKNLDNKNVKDNLTEDINEQLNEALDRRGQREAPKAMKKLADNLFDNLKNAIQKEKKGNLLENILKKKILKSLNDVLELAGVSYATKRDNDKFSKDLATKILEVPPEYIDNEDVRDNLLEDINDRLNEALENRGQRKDPKETKELAKDILNELVDAIKRGKSSGKDSPSLVVLDPLENKLRQKVLEYLNDDPDLSGYTPSNKIYNDNISKAIAKKTNDLLPKLLEDDNVRNQLLEEINDQLKDTLEDRGIDKSPKIIKKMANDLLNNLVNAVKESQEGNVSNLEKDLRKIVQAELENTPQLSGRTASSITDNDNLIKDIAKQFLEVPPKNLDNDDVEYNLIKNMNDRLNGALEKMGQREAPKAMKKLADNLFDKLKNAIQKEKEGNLLECILRKKILESLNEVPELAGVSSATKRDNDIFSQDLAKKVIGVPPEDIDNGDVKDHLLEYINDELNEAFKKRRQHNDPEDTKKLATNMLNQLVDAIKNGRKDVSAEPKDLMDSLKSALKPSSSLEDDDVTKKVRNWFKDIPKLSEGDNDKNNELIHGLANKLKKIQDDGEDGRYRQKIKDVADYWLEDTFNKKGLQLNKKEKEKLMNKLADVFKSIPLQKSQSTSADDDEEMSGPLWDWFKDIPELYNNNKLENKLNVDALDKKLKKFGDRILDTDGAEEIEDVIEDWLEDMADKKNVKMYSKQRKQLRKKLMEALYPNYNYKDEDSLQKVWEWFMDIPEISGGDKIKIKKLVKKLDNKLKKIQNENFDEEVAKHKMQGSIDNWLQDIALIKGEKLNTRIKEELRNKLMFSLQSRSVGKRKKNRPHHSSSHGFEEFHNGPQIRDWFNNIPELSNGNQSDDKKHVDNLIKNIQKNYEKNTDGDKEQNYIKLIGLIDSWLREMANKKDAKLSKGEMESHRNNLMNSLKPKRTNNKMHSASDVEGQKTEKQKLQEWFENISKLCDGYDVENKKLIDDLAKTIEKIHEQNNGNGKIANEIKDEVDTWIKIVSKKKRVGLSLEEVEALKKILLDSISNKPRRNAKQKYRIPVDKLDERQEVSISDETDSDVLDKITKSESLESDKDTDESDSTSNKPKHKATEKIINKLKAYKSALKRFKDVSAYVDEDRQNISEWLKTIPVIKFDDESENILTDKLSAKLKTLRKEGKIYNKKEMNNEVKNWLEEIYKKEESQLDNRTKEDLIKKLIDTIKSKKSKNKNGNLSSDQSVNDTAQKLERRASRSPEKASQTTDYSFEGPKDENNLDSELLKKKIDTKNKKGNLSSDHSVDDTAQKPKRKASRSPEKASQTTNYSFEGPKDENNLDSELLKKEINTKTPDGDNKIGRSSSSYSKDRNRWNKEADVRFSDHNNDESPTRSIESPLNKYDTNTIMSEDEDTASYKSHTLSIKTPELGSPSSASHGSQLDYKFSRSKPTPEKDLRQLIIGAGIEPKIMSESSYQYPNKHKKNPTIKERQKSKGSILSLSPKRKSSVLNDTRNCDIPLTISETSLRPNPRLRARSDVASRKLIEKTIMKPESKIIKKKSPSNSNRSDATELYYVEESDSNEQRLRRKSIATQQPIQKSSKKNGEGEDSTKTRIKFDKLTKAKISDFLAKNIDTITSPNYADVEEDIMLILTEDVDLPANEIRALARMIIKRTRRDNGIEDSNDDFEEDDVTIYELDSDSDKEDDATDKIPRMMSKARHLVRGVFDETYDFEEDPETQTQLEDAIVGLIADQLVQGDINDPTKDAILKLLRDANVPEHIADDICDKVMRRARERPMSFSEYRPPLSPHNRIDSALTPNQKLTFLENARREIADFYDELTAGASSDTKEIINEAIKDTVAKLADILDDPELTGEQKEDLMKNEIIRYLRKLPTQSNVPEEDLANQLMERVQNIKFTSSTPEHSEVEGFHPRRQNLDSSLSTIFDENELEANEIRFKDTLVDAILKWSGNIDAIKENVGFKDTMAKDLANEIIDRQKYLQVNPDAKSSEEEELEHAKYIVFKWLNRMANLNDLADSGIQIENLVNSFYHIPVPKMAEPLKNASLWASGSSQGNVNYDDPFVADVAGWFQSVPKNVYAGENPYIQEQQIKQFVDTMKKHKNKPNVEELAGEEINKWLPTMVNADQVVTETMGNQLKNILKMNGFVNPPQGPATFKNKNTTLPEQPMEPKVTLQQQLPVKSAILSHHPEPESKQPPLSMELQHHDKSPQQTEQSKQSSVSRTPPSLIPPQDYQYIVGNQQNPQIVPTDNVTSKVNDWVSTLPFNANNPEEQQHFDKMKQNLISQIKQIRQQYPTTSNEYETKLREAIKFFLQNIPLDPEKNQDDRYLDDKTNELLFNLGLIPTDTAASPKFKKPVDVLYDAVDKWCKDLPIYSENHNEDPEKTSALKQNISSKLIYKLGELNMNPEILNDDFLYEDLLLDEVDRQLKDVPRNPELDKYLPALKMELAAKVKDARQKIRDELAGQAYKQQLRDTISTSICLPDNLSPDEQASFEILKDNLADAFINLHYVPDNPEDAKKFKIKINNEINRFCDQFLRRHPRLPVDRRKLTQDLYAALLSVPVPRDESMIHEVEHSRIKDIIDDWMKELPLRDETSTEQLHRIKTASLLAKHLHDLENEKKSNPDLENEIFEEISKWLRKQHLRPGQEVYIPEFADRLKNKLKSTEHSRRFDLSARPPHQTQSKPGMVCMARIPPCTLSREDQSHLKRIRERHVGPCGRVDIVCPRVESFVEDRPCSQDDIVCPRINTCSQTDVKPKCSDRGCWCRKEFCPERTQTPTQTPGSYCSMRKNRDASCMTPTQSPYEISPHVIVNEYYWDTTDGSKQTSFQQTRPPLQQPQGSHTSQQSYHAPPPPDYQTPRQLFQQQAPHYVPPGPHYTTPQPSTSSAHQQPYCECHKPINEEMPCFATRSRCKTRHRRCFRNPDASSGDENYPEPSPSRCRRVRVTKLGSLDDTSCQRNRRSEQKTSRSRICDDDSEWSSVRFPEDREFWDCPRHRFYGARGPFIQEKEKREEKFKCKCKERILTSCRGRNGRSHRQYDTRHCDINCPHPSYMYFR